MRIAACAVICAVPALIVGIYADAGCIECVRHDIVTPAVFAQPMNDEECRRFLLNRPIPCRQHMPVVSGKDHILRHITVLLCFLD